MANRQIDALTNDLQTAPSTDDATLQTLLEIARRYGTPTYAFDLSRLRAQVLKLQRHLPAEVEILYSLKANASLGICDVFAECGIGADVASAGELATAVAAGFDPKRIFVAGPYKLPETIAHLRESPEAVVSIDSPSELRALVDQNIRNRLVLRLRPDFGSLAVVSAGHESRFGFTVADLPACRNLLNASAGGVIGFHVFAGSQVLQAENVVEHLRGAYQLSLRAAETLGIVPSLLNLGGGFGIPYGPHDRELNLQPIGEALARILQDCHRLRGPTEPPTRLVLELGRYLVAQAGWYLTSVVGHQSHQGRTAVVVDGGTHQRADMCGLCLRSKARPPLVLDAAASSQTPTDVWGCLSLPADVLVEASPLPPLSPGNVLAFPNAGAYGLWSSPALFHGSPLPAEVGFEESKIQVMRERQSARSILQDQRHVQTSRVTS